MYHEVLEALSIEPFGCHLDGTCGRGGHSRGILESLGEQGRLVVIDRDPIAIDVAHELALSYPNQMQEVYLAILRL